MYGSENVRSERKMILNSNQGVTNIVESDVIRKDMGAVTNRLFNILKAHYGPYSKFGGIDPNRPLEDTIFTKDGANLIKNITFVSPLEDIARKAVLYIGENVEKSSGDGTTSSMMFMCAMLKHMTQSLDEILPVSYYQLSTAFADFLEEVKEEIERYTLHAQIAGEYNDKAIKRIAYAQAYTSSHGNHELASAVTDMFLKCPPEQWAKMTFARRHYESNKLFEIKTTEGQYELDDCTIMSKSVFNKDAGRYLEYKNATLVVINGKVNVTDPRWDTNVRPILDKCDEDNPVIILARHGADDYSYGELMKFTSDKNETTGKKHALAVVWYDPTHDRLNDFVNIQCIAGHNPLEYVQGNNTAIPCVIRNVDAKYEFDKLILNGLYENTEKEDDGRVHQRPQYNDSERPYFREWCDTVQKYIDAYEAGDLVNVRQKKELRDFRNVYNRLRYDRQIFLLIGGKTFDNLAMFDVVEDVIKAVIHTLDVGAVVSNNKTLYAAVETILSNLSKRNEKGLMTYQEKLFYWFAKNIKASLNEFSDVVLDMLYPKGISRVKDHPRNSIWYQIAVFLGMRSAKTDTFCETGISNNDPVMTGDIPNTEAFTQEERKAFRKWWFSRSVDLLMYDPTRMWYEQDSEMVSFPMHRVLDRSLTDSMRPIVQPANADIVMLERFAEIALKFILTERFIVCDSAYIAKDPKGSKK